MVAIRRSHPFISTSELFVGPGNHLPLDQEYDMKLNLRKMKMVWKVMYIKEVSICATLATSNLQLSSLSFWILFLEILIVTGAKDAVEHRSGHNDPHFCDAKLHY